MKRDAHLDRSGSVTWTEKTRRWKSETPGRDFTAGTIASEGTPLFNTGATVALLGSVEITRPSPSIPPTIHWSQIAIWGIWSVQWTLKSGSFCHQSRQSLTQTKMMDGPDRCSILTQIVTNWSDANLFSLFKESTIIPGPDLLLLTSLACACG